MKKCLKDIFLFKTSNGHVYGSGVGHCIGRYMMTFGQSEMPVCETWFSLIRPGWWAGSD